MGAGHAHALYIHEHSRVHLLAPHTKLVAVFVFAMLVAVTPREQIWAFLLYGALLALVAYRSRVPAGFIGARLTAIAPFLIFALLIPFVASGEQVEILGLQLSESGLWGTWNILAKATLGATAAILLAATTEVPDMLRGMTTLRVPPTLTSIAAFMIRYLEVIAEEFSRTRTAMTARAYDPRWLWQAKPIASSAGAMFVRSYERGERTHAAMAARGFTGSMPQTKTAEKNASDWPVTISFLALTALVTALALVAA